MPNDVDTKALEKIEAYLKHILVIQLYQAGVDQRTIAQHLKASLSTVNELLKGVEKGKKKNENLKPQNN